MTKEKRTELEKHLLKNAKVSYYLEGVIFNEQAWEWYVDKDK